MPHRDFDVARRSWDVDRDPVTFALAGETFTVVPDPSLGDTFDLADAPDISADDFDPDRPADTQLIRVLTRFLRRMIPPDDRARFDAALYKVPARHSGVIIEINAWITEQVIARPTVPPSSSSSGRQTTGRASKPKSAGKRRSKPSQRGGRTR